MQKMPNFIFEEIKLESSKGKNYKADIYIGDIKIFEITGQEAYEKIGSLAFDENGNYSEYRILGMICNSNYITERLFKRIVKNKVELNELSITEKDIYLKAITAQLSKTIFFEDWQTEVSGIIKNISDITGVDNKEIIEKIKKKILSHLEKKMDKMIKRCVK